LGITALIAAIRAGPGDDQAQIPGHRQSKAGGIGGFTPEQGPQGLTGDGVVTLSLDGGDDGLQGDAFLGEEPAPGIAGDAQIDLFFLEGQMVGDLRGTAQAGAGGHFEDTEVVDGYCVHVMAHTVKLRNDRFAYHIRCRFRRSSGV
jgi:hypothetical protein